MADSLVAPTKLRPCTSVGARASSLLPRFFFEVNGEERVGQGENMDSPTGIWLRRLLICMWNGSFRGLNEILVLIQRAIVHLSLTPRCRTGCGAPVIE